MLLFTCCSEREIGQHLRGITSHFKHLFWLFWMLPGKLVICIKFTKKTDNFDNKVLTTVYYVRTGFFFKSHKRGLGEKSCLYLILWFRMCETFCKTATFSLKTNGKDIQKSCKRNDGNNRLIMGEKWKQTAKWDEIISEVPFLFLLEICYLRKNFIQLWDCLKDHFVSFFQDHF